MIYGGNYGKFSIGIKGNWHHQTKIGSRVLEKLILCCIHGNEAQEKMHDLYYFDRSY
jgi:VCBS repeat-containing protein